MLPIEMEIQPLRMIVETKALEGEWMRERYEQLALIDKKRMRAQHHV